MGKGRKSGNKVLVDESPREVVREAVVTTQFREDMQFWTDTDPRTASRAWDLINDVMRSPFKGIGKPEPLKHVGSDVWSRRLTHGHRIVYKICHAKIEFLQARYHYDD